jgi:hypothetical protein
MSLDHPGLDHPDGSPIFRGGGSPIFTHLKDGLSQVTEMCLAGTVAPQGIKAVKELLDFIFLSQYPMHNEQTLKCIEDALDLFHKNKSFFIEVGCHPALSIPKFHSLIHYIDSIQFFSTTDNYNTEQATNQRDKFPQMIQWLSHHKKVDTLALGICMITTHLTTPPKSTTVWHALLPLLSHHRIYTMHLSLETISTSISTHFWAVSLGCKGLSMLTCLSTASMSSPNSTFVPSHYMTKKMRAILSKRSLVQAVRNMVDLILLWLWMERIQKLQD